MITKRMRTTTQDAGRGLSASMERLKRRSKRFRYKILMKYKNQGVELWEHYASKIQGM
jgi:hypothetical protein